MVQQNGYDVRGVHRVSMKDLKNWRETDINTLNKNEIDIITLSKAVLKRLAKELRLKVAKTEITAIARANAISDIQNFAAANHVMVPITTFNLTINSDATQCKIRHKK